MIGDSVHPLAAIAKAAPFVDASFDQAGGKWRPSELMKLVYFVTSTSGRRDAVDHADEAVRDLLNEARNRYAAGFYADPFAEPVQVRPQ
jgi:hypothetical protein